MYFIFEYFVVSWLTNQRCLCIFYVGSKLKRFNDKVCVCAEQLWLVVDTVLRQKSDECLTYCSFGSHSSQSMKYILEVIYRIRNFRICTWIIIISFCSKVTSDFRTRSVLACSIGVFHWQSNSWLLLICSTLSCPIGYFQLRDHFDLLHELPSALSMRKKSYRSERQCQKL